MPFLRPSALLSFSWLLFNTGSLHMNNKMATQNLGLTAPNSLLALEGGLPFPNPICKS